MTATRRPAPPHGHVCWRYDGPAALYPPARDFIIEGLAAGLHVWYVGASPGLVADRLTELDVFRDALRSGAARIVTPESTYADIDGTDPAAQVRTYEAATEAALAAGYAGLRVVADATGLVDTPERLDAFARYEHLADRYMSGRPMSAMCAFDRRILGDRTIAELACMHPVTNVEEALFRLYADAPGEGHAALAGELDAANHDLFRTVLERADPRPVDGRLVLAADELRFVDHHCLFLLRDHARRLGATIILRTPHSAAARLAELLDLPEVRVEVVR